MDEFHGQMMLKDHVNLWKNMIRPWTMTKEHFEVEP